MTVPFTSNSCLGLLLDKPGQRQREGTDHRRGAPIRDELKMRRKHLLSQRLSWVKQSRSHGQTTGSRFSQSNHGKTKWVRSHRGSQRPAAEG